MQSRSIQTKKSGVEQCAGCRTRDALTSRRYLILDLTELPLAANCLIIVLCVSELLDLTRSAALLFSLLATIPVVFHLGKRHFCQRCQREVEEDL